MTPHEKVQEQITGTSMDVIMTYIHTTIRVTQLIELQFGLEHTTHSFHCAQHTKKIRFSIIFIV